MINVNKALLSCTEGYPKSPRGKGEAIKIGVGLDELK